MLAALSRNSRYGRPSSRSQHCTGSGAGVSSSTSGVTWSSIPDPDPRSRIARLRGRCVSWHVFRPGVVRRRQIAPGQRALLTIGLAERHREAGFRQLLAEIEGVRGIVHLELREDRLDVGAAHEALVVEDGDGLGVGEDAEVRIGDLGLQRAQLLLRVAEHDRILHGDEPLVHALGDRVLRHRVVHQPPGDVHFTHGAARPGNDFGREHGANAQLLAHGNQQRVHAGRIRRGQLGEIADPHQHLGRRPPPPALRRIARARP